jgi:hypothetical protein
MVTLKINALKPSYINDYIEAQTVLKDVNKFYQLGEDLVELINSEDGIPCCNFDQERIKGLKRIAQSQSDVVALEIEGLPQIIPFLEHYNPDKKYIFFCGNTWDTDHYKFPFQYALIESKFHIFQKMFSFLNYSSFNFFTPVSFDFEETKPYLFNATIGAVRPLRDIFFNELKDNIEFKNYILKYAGQDYGATDYFKYDFETIKSGKNFEQYGAFSGYEKYWLNLSETIPLKTFNQSWLNVVVETQIDYEKSYFITEKTIKCLMIGMPFVCYATQDHMKYTRDLGFRTYNDMWDENYDSLPTPELRAKALVKLINNLYNFDWKSAIPKFKEIQNHNRANLFDMRTRELSIFLRNNNILKDFLKS